MGGALLNRLLLFVVVVLILASIGSATEDPMNYNTPNRFNLMAVGDISFSGIAHIILKDPAYPWKGVSSLLNQADILIGNLEAPLSKRGAIYTKKKWLLRADPRTAESLAQAGFDLVTLANNHILDYGPVALQDTIDALDQVGICHTGAGADGRLARQPVYIVTNNGKTVAFLAYSLVYPEVFWANSKRPGAAHGDPSYFIPDIKKAKSNADFVVVSFHWSNEMVTKPRDYQKKYGKMCIDAGASLVIGHHPHVLQGIEVYKDGLIAYSLGNFVFGVLSHEKGDSIILNVLFDENGLLEVEIYPINVDNHYVSFQPQFQMGDNAKRILNTLRNYSQEFGTYIEEHENIGIIRVRKELIND
jgi:poly-gamma-glutamate capsule biosynthesis protein CapA/YwtB (metallophosphatase superfamily)